jgi:flagellar FliL protein
MATARNAPNAGQADAAPAKSNKMLFIILGLVVVLLIGGGAAAFFLLGSKEQAGETHASKPDPEKPPVFMTLEPFTVNLAMDDGMQQFLQIGMTVQVADQAQSDLIKLYLPQVRSRLLLLLTSKKATEILTVEGKTQLAGEIVKRLEESFSEHGPKPDVSGVFFTSFVVQ